MGMRISVQSLVPTRALQLRGVLGESHDETQTLKQNDPLGQALISGLLIFRSRGFLPRWCLVAKCLSYLCCLRPFQYSDQGMSERSDQVAVRYGYKTAFASAGLG